MQAVQSFLLQATNRSARLILRPLIKALPFLLRYLAVVMASCLLALIISTSHAHAATTSAPAAERTVDRSAPGPYAVQISEAVWRDEVRKREVPVRICAPKPGKTADKVADRVPVILFSHGLGGNREGGKIWAEHWAGYGYLVVQMQHAGSDDGLWKGKPVSEIAGDLKGGMSLQNLLLRIADVKFVIDEVLRRADAKEGPFAMADTARIGMSGHSFGAQTTLAVAGQSTPWGSGVSGLDKRITAAIAFSPNARTKTNLDAQYGDIRMPFFSITGTRDAAILGDGTVYTDRQVPFRHMPKGDKYLVTFRDGDHMVFGGHTLRGKRVVERDSEIQKQVKAATLAFWDASLKGDKDAQKWLQADFKAGLGDGDSFEWK